MVSSGGAGERQLIHLTHLAASLWLWDNELLNFVV